LYAGGAILFASSTAAFLRLKAFYKAENLLPKRYLEIGIYLIRIVERLSDLLEGIYRFPAVLDGG